MGYWKKLYMAQYEPPKYLLVDEEEKEIKENEKWQEETKKKE